MAISKTLGIIGFGNMAKAILEPVLASGLFLPENVIIYNPTPGKASEFIDLGCRYASSAVEASKSDFVLLGVKPFKVREVLHEICSNLSGRCLISIAAGITVDSMQEICGHNVHIVRTMPNATLTVGCGATVLAEAKNVPEDVFETVKAIFSCAGVAYVLPEEKINEITAVNGSSPAFFYRILDVMVKNAVGNGIDASVALQLAAKTMEGAARIMQESNLSAAELIRIVATPGGTTQAALESMDKSEFDKSLSDAMDACTKRTYELAK